MEHVDQQVDAADASVRPAQETDEASSAADATEQIDDVQALREELAEARRSALENQDKYLRARADMENYRKRTERTFADREKAARKSLLTKLLGVKDNIERALHYGEGSEGSGEGIIEGVRLTQYQLEQLLTAEGVTPIEAEGKPFDPHLEEAVQSIHDPALPDHAVVQVVRKGYTYQDDGAVLRPAQVVVNVHETES